MFRIMLISLALLGAPAAFAQTAVPQNQLEIKLSFAPLVKLAAPAVVNIYARRVTETNSNPFQSDPFFDRFFRGFGEPRKRVQNSLGSGVILSSDGIVVSNFHVVGMATDIRVVLSDRREFAAHVLLGDKDSDLAILKLDGADDLPNLPLRDSDNVEVGELALAIGNPFGVGQTVSSGIISGLARSGGAIGTGQGYLIQTDAPINPGNSGGALIDVQGSLIGINTAILSRSGGSNGIGFAIPSNLVSAFVDQANAGNNRFVRPWAGINGQPVDAELAETLGLNRPGGIVISDLHNLSPFKTADFKVGDVISAVDGMVVNSPAEMVFRMSITGPGKPALIEKWRAGKVSVVSVNLMRAPEIPARAPLTLGDRASLQGMIVTKINPAVISENNLPLHTTGVLIADPGPVGARLGFGAGDVIIAVSGHAVSNPVGVRRALKNSGRKVYVEVLRGTRRLAIRFRR